MERGMSDKGMEVAETRNVKLIMMRRALELLKHKLDDDYIQRAELELGEINHSEFEFEKTEDGNYRLIDNDTPAERKLAQRIYKRARQIEEKEWKELWKIVNGDLRGWWD
jgi:hypothetical protein